MSMSGMGMMLKSLGIDPDEMKGSVDRFINEVRGAVAEVRQQNETVLRNQAIIIAKLDLLLGERDGISTVVAEGIVETSEKFPDVHYGEKPELTFPNHVAIDDKVRTFS